MHGWESYVVQGERLSVDSGGGRAVADDLADGPRRTFRRLFPRGPQVSEGIRTKLASAMTAGGQVVSDIPAGYMFLAQFVDHDLTFDAASVTSPERLSPAVVSSSLAAGLDLDCVYGSGPGDPVSARFYEAHGYLRLGATAGGPGLPAFKDHDLPRVGTGRNPAAQRLALVPDQRSDESLALAQIHVAFSRFHNRVLAKLLRGGGAVTPFSSARDEVVKHYQWILRTDLLPRICDPQVVEDVFERGRKVVAPDRSRKDFADLNLEFSLAAFRFGHSMVRDEYSWSSRHPHLTIDMLFSPGSANSGELAGAIRLPSEWVPDFQRLFDLGSLGRPRIRPWDLATGAARIGTRLAPSLAGLPSGSIGGAAAAFDNPIRNLAYRNLTRASMLRLATGQQAVSALAGSGVRTRVLSERQIIEGSRDGVRLGHLTMSERDSLVRNTPLWFYVLREAELNGGRLTGVGARIVVETVHHVMEGSACSIVRDRSWRPTMARGGRFTMPDLLWSAFDGKRTELDPLGG